MSKIFTTALVVSGLLLFGITFGVKPATANAPIVDRVEFIEIPAKKVEKSVNLPPIMVEIARCESGNRQFNDDGSVRRGIINPKDVGEFQINETYHLLTAQKLGFDIYTREGNRGYAMYLYKTQGTAPWNWSKTCWQS